VKVLPAVTGLVAVAAALTACGGSSGAKATGAPGPVQHPASLLGVVGHNDAFSISLTDPSGQAISNLAAGTYSLTIKDESTIHDFHLTGAGVDKATPVGSTSTSTFSVTFKPGTYSFVCDPHAGQMHGKFTVT
jgi:hypothetical protein